VISVKRLLHVLLFLTSTGAFGVTPSEIVSINSHAIVYLEVENSAGEMITHGTGFIVSQDGYVLTVNHVKPLAGQQLVAVIGQKSGTKFPVTFRDADENSDIALWQLPQSATCRYSVAVSDKDAKVLDRVVALGFPENEGLAPSPISITNTTSQLGFYKADGLLSPGNSGGPVFNEAGFAIALVEGGGIPGSQNNDLIPIAPAIALLKKHSVRAGFDKPVIFADSCYASCRTKENGIESWKSQTEWHDSTGWMDGGSDPVRECDKLMAARLVGHSDSEIELFPGTKGRDEDSKKDVLGHVSYMYKCGGTLRSGPIYVQKQSPSCGLWQ
jgi:S1-C subfamily serine protease